MRVSEFQGCELRVASFGLRVSGCEFYRNEVKWVASFIVVIWNGEFTK
ncbi:MAG: hypothetical protein HC803_11185 [Saprospiraceae bacterium]|nr:hypothetical protein [Saprospiraceae bacterium]